MKQKYTPYLYFLLATLFYFFVIFGFSSQTGTTSSGISGRLAGWISETCYTIQGRGREISLIKDLAARIEYPIRKIGHLSEYAVLAFLIAGGIRNMFDPRKVRRILCAVPVVTVLAAADEFHQYFVPGRSALVTDVLIDTAGAAAGVLVYWLIHKCKDKIMR